MTEESIPTSEITELLEYLTPQERDELEKLIALQIWDPLPGPQSLAYSSLADITGYGGAAGGGKTDLACGLALTKHYRTIIYRREGTQLHGIYDRLTEILGGRDGFNGQDKIWRIPSEGRIIEFGGVPYLEDRKKFQGRPHDLKVFDEVTEFLEMQVRFLMGWMRTSIQGVRCRVLMTFNPPTTAEGRWVVDYFGPWLNPNHHNPARVGELRWYTSDPKTGKDLECDGPDPIIIDGEECRPLSRTFIPAKVEDNPYYMATGYKSVLQALPEPLRSQMLLGDFTAGIEDDPWQVIPTDWVEQAMARWEKRAQKGVMTSLGCDPSRGGRDETVLAPRYGTWFDELIHYPGQSVPDGPTCAGLALGAVRNGAPIVVDIIGIGSSVYDHLKAIHPRTVGLNVSEKTDEMCVNHKFKFKNKRSLMWWRMREDLDPARDIGVCLPPDDKLKADLTAPKWKLLGGGIIQVESKEEVKDRIGRSTDSGDAVCQTNIKNVPPAPRSGGRAPALSIA